MNTSSADAGSFELIPAIDLKGGKCVRLAQGRAEEATEYSDHPPEVARHWEALGATRLHLVDLDGAFTGSFGHLQIVDRIVKTLKIPVQFGGGIRTLDHLEHLLGLGVERVILGTVAVTDPEIVERGVDRFGSAIAVAIDARDGRVAVKGWTKDSTVPAIDLAKQMASVGVQRVIYTDVSRDGMLRGVNVTETERMARDTGLRVIASGGVAGMDDIRALWSKRACGIEGVILGRALYERKLDLPSALRSLSGLSGPQNGGA